MLSIVVKSEKSKCQLLYVHPRCFPRTLAACNPSRRASAQARQALVDTYTCRSSAALMNPLPSLSNTLEGLFDFFFRVCVLHLACHHGEEFGKSMVPLPSASTSLTMSWSSASVGF